MDAGGARVMGGGATTTGGGGATTASGTLAATAAMLSCCCWAAVAARMAACRASAASLRACLAEMFDNYQSTPQRKREQIVVLDEIRDDLIIVSTLSSTFCLPLRSCNERNKRYTSLAVCIR